MAQDDEVVTGEGFVTTGTWRRRVTIAGIAPEFADSLTLLVAGWLQGPVTYHALRLPGSMITGWLVPGAEGTDSTALRLDRQ